MGFIYNCFYKFFFLTKIFKLRLLIDLFILKFILA